MGITCKTMPSLCWDCSKSIGEDKCPWASSYEPIEGWLAHKTKKASTGDNSYSYLVVECPLFKRDAVRGGLFRYKEGDLV